MRHYPSDSPEAMGRLVALTLMADGAIDASELRQLDHTDTIRRLGLDEAGFDKVIHDLCNDMLTSAHRTPAGQLELDVDNKESLAPTQEQQSQQRHAEHQQNEVKADNVPILASAVGSHGFRAGP